MANRDNFAVNTKRKLAERAGFLCSYCKCRTVGPSQEADDAVTNIGVAAHISAAAKGGPRYNPDMTSSERSYITNGIWLCGSCATLIDRDEIRFTVESLHLLRLDHEENQKVGEISDGVGNELVSVGRSIVATGYLIVTASDFVTVRLSHFVEGRAQDLFTFANDYDQIAQEDRFLLLSELGYGRELNGPPRVERKGQEFEVLLPVKSRAKAFANALDVKTMCRDTLEIISGMDALIQTIEDNISMAYGTWFANIKSGSYVSDIYWARRNDPWFLALIKSEIIRLASIPSVPGVLKSHQPNVPPLICTTRVNDIEISSTDLDNHRLRLTLDLDLEGVGNWRGELWAFVCSPEDLKDGRKRAIENHKRLLLS